MFLNWWYYYHISVYLYKICALFHLFLIVYVLNRIMWREPFITHKSILAKLIVNCWYTILVSTYIHMISYGTGMLNVVFTSYKSTFWPKLRNALQKGQMLKRQFQINSKISVTILILLISRVNKLFDLLIKLIVITYK